MRNMRYSGCYAFFVLEAAGNSDFTVKVLAVSVG